MQQVFTHSQFFSTLGSISAHEPTRLNVCSYNELGSMLIEYMQGNLGYYGMYTFITHKISSKVFFSQQS